MVAVLTFGKYRDKYPDHHKFDKYIKNIQTIRIPYGFMLGSCSFDYYGIPTPNSKNAVVAEVIECKDVFFKFLYKKYTDYDFNMEVFDLSKSFPILNSKYPQGLVYFTRNNTAERTFIEDAVIYETEKNKRKLTNAYCNEEDDDRYY
ncbi:MAG: hypothetical protein E6R13_07165 [Spirochaetes bacterium]|nr:MAG: hypothetical protein E6R13_07165 [Spirochaetota bacterium]